MNKKMWLAILTLLCCASLMWAAGDKTTVTTGDTLQAKAPVEKEKAPIEEYLIGAWTVAARPGVASEEITFNDDGTYLSKAKHDDDVGVETKGEYRLYTDQEPCGIDLCPGKCGQPGSEWTTSFGIIRMLEDGGLHIRTSPNQNRPTEFSGEKDAYNLLLTRLPAEKE